jgi:hypothetical protein
MSFEGYYQCLCENGHYSCRDPFDSEDDFCCPSCDNKTIAWENLVDQTNPCIVGYIPVRVLKEHCLVSERVTLSCNLGHTHEIAPVVFRIPTPEETKLMLHISSKIFQQ